MIKELEHARKSCGIDDSPSASPAAATVAAGTHSCSIPATTAAVNVRVNPDGADITIDGKFWEAHTSKLQLTEGTHTILVEQTGFAAWQRTVTISPGNDININAVLIKTPVTP